MVKMVQIVELDEDTLKQVPHVVELLYEIFGPVTIGLFAVLVDNELGFVGRNGVDCVYIHNDGYNNFTLTQDEELGAIRIDGFDVFFGDDIYFVDKNKIECHVDLLKLSEPDQDDYDGYVSYKQYNPSNDTLCEIRYQHMYREMDSRPIIYGYHTKKIDCLYIDEDYSKKKMPSRGFIPKRSKYYSKIEFEDEELGYKLALLKEYGLMDMFGDLSEIPIERNLIRYIQTKYIDANGCYHDFWPLGEQLKIEELNRIIESYGFKTELPWEMIEIYNGRNNLVNNVRDIVSEMKVITNEMKEEPNDDTITKCALLRLRNE